MKRIIDFFHALFTRNTGLRKYGKYKVIYPDGKSTGGMPFGTAYDYQKIFGGTIEKLK